MRTRFFAVAVAVLVLPTTILAATWTVKPDGTGDFPTIQAAVNAAVANDVILLTDGTFSGAGNRAVTYLGKAITITSVNGPSATTISCGGQNGFQFLNSETSASVLRDVTIDGANSAVQCNPGSPTIINCVITGATVGLDMGAFFLVGPKLPSHPQATQCWLSACATGIVTRETAGLTLSNTTVTACNFAYAAGGGAVSASSCNFASNNSGLQWSSGFQPAGSSFTNCTFTGHVNYAAYLGGSNGASFTNCTFEGNHPAVITSSIPTLTVDGCTFRNNSGANGGAIFGDGGNIRIYDSVFCQNTATGAGGAVYVYASFDIQRNTFVNNSAAAGAGGVHFNGVGTTGPFQNNIIAFSTAGPGVLCTSGPNPTLSCNDVYGNAGGDGICGTDGGNNFSLDPQLCSQGCDDVGLSAGSPCAPANNPCGVQIGARGVTCAPVPVLFQRASARVAGESVVVSWSVIADETIVKFSIVRAADEASHVIADGLGVDAHEFVDKTVQPNTGYRYTVVATTSGGDVFQSQAIDVKTPRAELELSQNQPNPFNPSTRIDYSLPVASVVDIAVFDVAGRRVATLVAGPRPAGGGSVVWGGRDDDGQSVASGIYVCRMAANGDARTMKMVLLK
jgi:predicted outer membrane repeat protein